MARILELLNQIEAGEMVLPAIQRDFVWSKDDIRALVDSILRGYPIGLALLWETYNDIQVRPFVKHYRSANLPSFTTTKKKRVRLVLDGQQRLQSLYVALYGSYEGRSLYLDVLSGLESEDTSEDRYLLDFYTSKEAAEANKQEVEEGYPPFLYVRTSDLFAMTLPELLQFRREKAGRLKLSDNWAALLEENCLRFKDALERNDNVLQVSTIDAGLTPDSPSRKTEADVVEIFVRVNSLGTDLSRADLIFSLLKLNWKESAEALPEFVRTINQGNNLDIKADFVIRCLLAVSDLGSKMNIELLRKHSNVAAMQKNFGKCCDAIRATVDFVVQHCRCQSPALTGGLNTLVPFVYYFFHLPSHDMPKSEAQNAKNAFYLIAFGKTFSRYGDSRIATFISRALRPRLQNREYTFPLRETAQLIARWERPEAFDLTFMERNTDLTLALVQGFSGTKWQYAANAPEVDHIFPKSTLRDKGFDSAEINTVRNYWILAKGKNRNKSNHPPAKYLADVDEANLQNAIIDRDLLQFSRYKRFIRERGTAMEKKIQKSLGIPASIFDSTKGR